MGSPCRTPISHPHPRLLSHLSLSLADPIKARTSLNSPPPPKEKKTHLCHRQGRSRRHFILSLPPLHALLLANCCQALEGFDAVSERERDASQLTSRRVGEAVELLKKGRESQAQGDFGLALRYYTLVIEGYKDFALSEYARVGRALALYEVGDRDEAIAEMEDVSISLRGYPEVHAALAAALYVDKHAPLLAENQFTIATLLDPHYTDVSYVRETKHWPPSLVSSLQQFITLT